MIREGVDDALYVATLESLIKKGSASETAKLKIMKAERELNSIFQQIDDNAGIASPDPEDYKGKIPPYAKTAEWRRKIADSIVEIQSALSAK